MTPILELSNVTKKYPKFTLDNISFILPKGRIMGLIGENGAGKSTTIYAILDLIKKDGGSVKLWGKDLSENEKEIKEKIGVVFDELNFHETLTPIQVGKISEAAYRQWNEDKYIELLGQFDIIKEKKIKELSKGMKKKLSLAVALSHNPQLLILDEPTSGLDPIVREELLEIFLDFIQEEDHSILLSSHITTDLEKIADEITFIHKGKLLFSKEKDELIYNYGIIRTGTSKLGTIDKEDILSYRKGEYQLDVLVKDREKALRKYKGMTIDTATIEEIMLLYIKGEQIQ